MWDLINDLSKTVSGYDGINNKDKLIAILEKKYFLEKKRKIYFNEYFSLRFSQAKSLSFGNTVLSLSVLAEYDNNPFIVCVVCPDKNYLLLGNTTFIKKISHSSHNLSINNIKGSFNGSDIIRIYNSIKNIPTNFQKLFEIHQTFSFEYNLQRLVNETMHIVPIKQKYLIIDKGMEMIKNSSQRALSFINSKEYKVLKEELDAKVTINSRFIYLASLISNVNIRGRLIEYLITGEDEEILKKIKTSLVDGQVSLPEFKTKDDLGDYNRIFDDYYTEIDIKTKLSFLNSNPKAYNIDKMLEFLTIEKSVFLFYFIDISMDSKLDTYLISMFDERIINNIRIQYHWAGRSSRGVTQINGDIINNIRNENIIKLTESDDFLNKLIEGRIA